MKPVVVLGSGGHAKCVIDTLLAMEDIEVVGCVADDTDPTRLVVGVPIIGPAERIESLADEGLSVAIGLGGWTDNAERAKLFHRAVSLGLDIVTVIDPRAHVSPTAVVGRGSSIFPGVHIAVDAVVGENVVIAANAFVHHESRIGDHVLLSAGVSIGGGVTIGSGTLVAIGATVTSGVEVGEGCLVAAGAVVVQNVPSGTSVRGVPAKPVG